MMLTTKKLNKLVDFVVNEKGADKEFATESLIFEDSAKISEVKSHFIFLGGTSTEFNRLAR